MSRYFFFCSITNSSFNSPSQLPAPLTSASPITGMDMRQPDDGTSLPNRDRQNSTSSGNSPSKMCNIFESSKRKRKSVAVEEKHVEYNQPAAKRPNTRQEASSAQDQATCSATLDEPQPSGSGTNNHSNGNGLHHQLHHNSNHLHPPSVAGPSTSSDICTSDSSVPPSDFDLASPDSIASILSPIGENMPSPMPVKQRTALKRKKSLPDKSPKAAKLKRGIHPDDGYLCYVTPSADLRLCPLPSLAWANADDVWRLMCRKDDRASLERDPRMLSNHPGIQPRMRAILLDWLIEVCEVYKLHRETFYLAVDYLDRYLSSNIKISKTRLQLIGITCLFVASKVEEIYPPKIGEFAYVTDGACTESDIVQQELILLSALKWSISPVTIIGWLSVYMQLNCNNRTPQSLNSLVNSSSCHSSNVSHPGTSSASGSQAASSSSSSSGSAKSTTAQSPADRTEFLKINGKSGSSQTCEGDAFVYPQFSGMEFAQTARLIDLCTLDIGLSNYPYSVVAAAAICLTINK